MESALQVLPLVAYVIAFASLILTIVLGIVLTFHWIRYAFAPTVTAVAVILYATVSGGLLAGIFASLTALSV